MPRIAARQETQAKGKLTVSEAEASVRDVVASINYVVRGEKATFHPGDREKSYWPAEAHDVTFHDVRPIRDQLSFDRNGFVLLDQPTNFANFDDKAAIDGSYAPEVEAMVQRATGADKVISFGAVVRTNASDAHGHNQPAFGAHVDYGLETVSDFARDILSEEEADRRLKGRFMLINVWRPIAQVESAPFAVCDASTVYREDLFPSEVVGGLGDFKRRSLWGFNLAYNPVHKWYWVPDMPPSDVLLFKLFDSDDDATQFTGHTAFNPPNLPADAAPRQSIELRVIAFLNA